jgi:hypothetical protein
MVARGRNVLAKALLAGLLSAADLGATVALSAAEPLPELPAAREVHEPILPEGPILEWGSQFDPSRWSARLGAVLLQRARPRSESLLTDLGTGESILDPAGMVFPFRGGADVGLARRGDWADLDFRYFGVEQWQAREGPVLASGGAQLNVPGVDPYAGPVTLKLNGASSLQSFELNLYRRFTPRLRWLVGLRYLAFRDAMRLTGGDATFTNYGTVNFGVKNNLFGLQIGGDGVLWDNGRRLRVESALKAGVYADGVHSSLTGYETNNPDTINFRTGRDNTAFVGDLNFVGVYQLDERWALRAGYQLLWLAGVGVGSMQFHDIDLVAPEFETNTSGAVFFHGALMGIERSW